MVAYNSILAMNARAKRQLADDCELVVGIIYRKALEFDDWDVRLAMHVVPLTDFVN